MILRLLLPFVLVGSMVAAVAADLTQELELASGGQFALGEVSFAVPGAFFGHKQGHDSTSDSLMLVHDNEAEGKYAVINIERQTAAAKPLPQTDAHRDALAYVVLGSRLLDLQKQGWVVDGTIAHDKKWSVAGIDFYHGTATGQSPKGELRLGFAYATIGDDLITVELQSPTSMWSTTYEEFRSLCFSAKRT